MADFSTTLDTLIAVVVVLLLLSLIVQSIQAGIKKLFKIKSKQIEDSLVYLIENALGESRAKEMPPSGSLPAGPAATPPGAKPLRWYNRSPFLRTILMLPDTPRDNAQPDVKALHDALLQRFAAVGRIAQYGSSALESLSKEDLSKVLASVDIKEFLDEAANEIRAACELVVDAQGIIDQIDKVVTSGDVQLKWAAFRDAVAPLFNDVAQLFDTNKKDFKVTLLVSHVLELRKIDLTKLLELASAVRTEAAKGGANAALLADIDNVIGKLRTVPARIDQALAPVKARITAVETWYDTVMQSFDERYTRSMRTWSFVIGLVVAIVLNADLFRIYDRLANDDVARQRVIAAQQKVVDAYERKKPEESPEQLTEKIAAKQKERDAETDATKKADLQKQLDELQRRDIALVKWSDDLEQELKDKTDQYVAFGFEPITSKEFGKHPVSSIFGWLVMALLLTLGAPFWNDALASLFGVKSLLQKKSETKSSEQKSGQGGTQPT